MVSWGERPSPRPVPYTAEPVSARRVYGRIYETRLRGQAPDEHPYVGRTTQTIHQRVHGRSRTAHTSLESVAKDPWKGRILPGRAGYRQLEVVYETGLGEQEDARALARAESFWIDKLQPTYNKVRPVRPFEDEKPTRQRSSVSVKRPPSPAKVALMLMMALGTIGATWLIAAMHRPWGIAPWIGGPVVGVLGAWWIFLRIALLVEWTRRRFRRYRRLFR